MIKDVVREMQNRKKNSNFFTERKKEIIKRCLKRCLKLILLKRALEFSFIFRFIALSMLYKKMKNNSYI